MFLAWSFGGWPGSTTVAGGSKDYRSDTGSGGGRQNGWLTVIPSITVQDFVLTNTPQTEGTDERTSATSKTEKGLISRCTKNCCKPTQRQ